MRPADDHADAHADTGAARTVLRTTAGDLPLHEYHLRADGHAWSILHTGAVLSHEEEARFLREQRDRVPYGVALWPASIALAHELIARAASLRGARVLELGAGTGLPGIVAATLGAHVVQTDRHAVALTVCRWNAERNGLTTIEHRAADWTAWTDPARYDLILGADILYATSAHDALRAILGAGLAPGGRALLADPFRGPSLPLLEAMAADGWAVTLAKWQVGEDAAPRGVGVYELTPPPA